jgi:hypothetical protein
MAIADPAARYLVCVRLASGETEVVPYPTQAEAAYVVALLQQMADGTTKLPEAGVPFVYVFPPSDAVVAVELHEATA